MYIPNIKKGIFFTFIIVSFCTFTNKGQNLLPQELPAPQTEIGQPLMKVFMLRSSSRNFNSKSIPLQELSNLLWAANGINRQETGKHTSPSAKNAQDIEIFVFLQQGIYLYEPKRHTLQPVLAGDYREYTGTQNFVKSAPVNLVYVSDLTKLGNPESEDTKIYSAADCGFIAQNVYLYCASQGLATVVRGSIERAKLSEVLKLKPFQKIILAQTIGYPE